MARHFSRDGDLAPYYRTFPGSLALAVQLSGLLGRKGTERNTLFSSNFDVHALGNTIWRVGYSCGNIGDY